MVGISRLKRAIADVPKGGMQTGSPKVVLKLADAERIMAEMENLISERAALAAENAELSQRELVHVGFTNEHQVTSVTEQQLDGYFYHNSDNECYIPLYMLNIHSHRVGPDSEIYKEHCERWKFRKENAEIRAEAGRAGFMECVKFVRLGIDPNSDHADIYAAKVRQGGAE